MRSEGAEGGVQSSMGDDGSLMGSLHVYVEEAASGGWMNTSRTVRIRRIVRLCPRGRGFGNGGTERGYGDCGEVPQLLKGILG